MNEQEQTAVNPWADAEVISVYTRAQALEDGVLVDLTDWAREAGFKIPVAVTQGVWSVVRLYWSEVAGAGRWGSFPVWR